jgi:putative addiction module killer protein
MLEVRRTEAFDKWLRKLRDTQARAKILVRAERFAAGNPGDVAPVGGGLGEMRIDFGPGYRVYFVQRGDVLTLLIGGDKSSQKADLRKAQVLVAELED